MTAETIDRRGARSPFSLEDWVVEPEANRISNGEISIHLEPKAMEVLLCLAEHAGVVVPRQIIVDQVWAAEFITDILPAGDWRMIGNGDRVLLDGIPDAATIPGGKRLNLRVPANTAHIYMDGWEMTNDEIPKPE